MHLDEWNERCRKPALSRTSVADRRVSGAARRGLVAMFGVVTLILANGCSNDVVCSYPPAGGIVLTVIDSQTHVVSNTNVTVIYIIDGGIPDTLRWGSGPDFDTPTIGFGARVGVYDITVRKPGYSDWTKSGIRVGPKASGCIPESVAVTAPLQKVS